MIHKINYSSYKTPSDFMKFEQGINKIIIVSNGGMVKKHGMKTARGYVNLGDCTETPTCEFCLKGNEAKLKWMWIIYLAKDRQVRLLDVGKMIGDAICKVAQTKGLEDLTGYEFTINKNGAGLRTEYQVSPEITKIQLSDADMAFIEPSKKFLVKKYFEK